MAWHSDPSIIITCFIAVWGDYFLPTPEGRPERGVISYQLASVITAKREATIARTKSTGVVIEWTSRWSVHPYIYIYTKVGRYALFTYMCLSSVDVVRP